jgi:hypothetical protein
MYHPKNRVAFHELVIDKELEQTKDFKDLEIPGMIGKMLKVGSILNKDNAMNCI